MFHVFLQDPYKPLLLVPNISRLMTASCWWSAHVVCQCDTVVLSYLSAQVLECFCWCLFFLTGAKKRTFTVFLWLEPNSWHTLTLSSFCFCGTLSLYGLRGHIVCESAFAPTQKCQALLSSQPLNYFRSLPEGKGDRIYFTDMKQKALRSQTGGNKENWKEAKTVILMKTWS